MRKTTRVLVAVTASLGLMLGASERAWGESGRINLGITNTIAAAGATSANLGGVVLIESQADCGFQISFQGDAASTANVGFYFQRSADNVTYESAPQLNFGVAINGTTAVCVYTNFTTLVGACPYFKLLYVTNAGAANLTNVVLQVVKKTIKPSP